MGANSRAQQGGKDGGRPPGGPLRRGGPPPGPPGPCRRWNNWGCASAPPSGCRPLFAPREASIPGKWHVNGAVSLEAGCSSVEDSSNALSPSASPSGKAGRIRLGARSRAVEPICSAHYSKGNILLRSAGQRIFRNIDAPVRFGTNDFAAPKAQPLALSPQPGASRGALRNPCPLTAAQRKGDP